MAILIFVQVILYAIWIVGFFVCAQVIRSGWKAKDINVWTNGIGGMAVLFILGGGSLFVSTTVLKWTIDGTAIRSGVTGAIIGNLLAFGSIIFGPVLAKMSQHFTEGN